MARRVRTFSSHQLCEESLPPEQGSDGQRHPAGAPTALQPRQGWEGLGKWSASPPMSAVEGISLTHCWGAAPDSLNIAGPKK